MAHDPNDKKVDRDLDWFFIVGDSYPDVSWSDPQIGCFAWGCAVGAVGMALVMFAAYAIVRWLL